MKNLFSTHSISVGFRAPFVRSLFCNSFNFVFVRCVKYSKSKFVAYSPFVCIRVCNSVAVCFLLLRVEIQILPPVTPNNFFVFGFRLLHTIFSNSLALLPFVAIFGVVVVAISTL